jgi:hypothetical protein
MVLAFVKEELKDERLFPEAPFVDGLNKYSRRTR